MTPTTTTRFALPRWVQRGLPAVLAALTTGTTAALLDRAFELNARSAAAEAHVAMVAANATAAERSVQ